MEQFALDSLTDLSSEQSNEVSLPLQQQPWLDKLWSCLFNGNDTGLMSPGQIRRERRDRDHVRQLEMSAIMEAEGELNEVHQGLKALDDRGNLIDTPAIDPIATHSIIENSQVEQDIDVALDTPATMIRAVVREQNVRDLERSLNIRKIAILAESEILASDPLPVSIQPVKIEWLSRWRESAQTVFNPELQLLWAQILIREVAEPGAFSLGLMNSLLQFERDDIDAFRAVGKYAFKKFVFQAEGYFTADSHHELFEFMDELGLMSAQPSQLELRSETMEHFELLLASGSKALKVTGYDARSTLSLPVYKLSRHGQQLVKLADEDADLAYLFNLANYIKEQDFEVALGDYVRVEDSSAIENAYSESNYLFEEKMRL